MKKIAIAALLSACVAAPAVASDCYDGIKVGQANYPYSNVSNNNQLAYGVLLGCNISPGFAVEAEYDMLGGFESTTGKIKGSSFGMSAVGIMPMNRQFSLFLKLGLAGTTLKDKAKPGYSGDFTYNNTGLTWGFGGQFNVSRVAGVRFSYDGYDISNGAGVIDSVGMFSVGGIFKF